MAAADLRRRLPVRRGPLRGRPLDLDQTIDLQLLALPAGLGAIMAFAPTRQFTLLAGEDAMTEYRFNTQRHPRTCSARPAASRASRARSDAGRRRRWWRSTSAASTASMPTALPPSQTFDGKQACSHGVRSMPARISRAAYADMFGPTVGDRVRLADTELIIEVEKDFTIYGEEVKFGGGKVIRDGMGQSQVTRAEGAVDTVITNALIVDHWGIVKADIGLRDGTHRRASARPAIPTPSPASTSSSAPAPRRSPARARSSPPAASTRTSTSSARSRSRRRSMSGVTTMLGGGTGPATGTNATTCTPGPWHLAPHDPGGRRLPDEPRLRRQGQRLAARRRSSSRSTAAPASLKLHEDWGTTPAAIDCCLSVADEYDVQVMIHTDTLNESGFVEDTDRRLQGPHHPRLPHRGRRRRPRARHHQGLRAAERHPVVDQSDAALHGEHARRASRHAHGLPPPRPVDPRGRRLRREPHPQGDHRRRGHPPRHRRLLDHRLRQPGDGPGRRGADPHLADRAQDEGAARPPAGGDAATTTISASSATSPRYTINPAIAHGLSTSMSARSRSASAPTSSSGSPAFFGVKPDLVLIGGTIAAAPMGDPNASIPTPQPVHYRPMFGAFGKALTALGGDLRQPGGARRRACRQRSASASELRRGEEHPRRHLQGLDDPQRRDAERSRSTRRPTRSAPTASCSPASRPTVLPMAQRYFLF